MERAAAVNALNVALSSRKSTNLGEDDQNHAITGQLFQEQIPAARVHRL
jgi:hypothetical protein